MKKLFFLTFSCFSLGLYAQSEAVIQQEELSEIVVSATRANWRTPTTFTNLRVSDVNNQMIMPEIPLAVSLSPSVVMTSENGSMLGNQKFRIRGTDATRINVTFDGVPVNDGESQEVFWVNMPDLMSSLQTMQIQRGVGASSNGAASFGGTLNMQSAQPATRPYGNATIMYGSFNTLKVNLGAGTGLTKSGWNADVRYSRGLTEGYIQNGDVEQQSLFFTGGYTSNQRIFKMNLFHGNQITGITWDGVPEDKIKTDRTFNPAGLYTNTDGETVRYHNETDNYTQTHLHLHYAEQINERLRLGATFYYTRGQGYYEQYRQYGDNTRHSRYIASSTTRSAYDLIRRRWLENNLVGAIATATYTANKTVATMGFSGSIYNNWHYGNIMWSNHPEIPGDNYQWHRNIGIKTDVSGFIKATRQFANRWYAFGDIQWRQITYKIEGNDSRLETNQFPYLSHNLDFNFFNPKLGITYVISSQQRAYASFAIGQREPKRADIKDALKGQGKELPRHEILHNVEAGYELNNEILTLGANFYYMNYKDQLVNTGKTSDSGYALMENVPESFRAGVELVFGVRPTQALQFNGNVTFSRNKIKNYVAYVDAYTDNWDDILPQRVEELGTTNIAFSPELIGAADVSYEVIKGLFFRLTAKYVGTQYYDNTSSRDRRLDAYFVNNAILQYRHDFTNNYYFDIQFALNNLWDVDYISNAAVFREDVGAERYIYRSFFPQPPRNFMVKLTVGMQ